WKTFERGEENCYLMTNGLGGFSSLTAIGSCSRNDHAVLMACVKSPNHRYNMIHRLEELLRFGEEKIYISSQDHGDNGVSDHAESDVTGETWGKAGSDPEPGGESRLKADMKGQRGAGAAGKNRREEGYLYQTGFTYEDYPEWSYLIKGVEIRKTIVLMQGGNGVGISYEIRNGSGEDVTLEVLPHLQFVPKGALLEETQQFVMEGQSILSQGKRLYFKTNGEVSELPAVFHDDLYYAYDVCDGRRATGCTLVNHCVTFTVRSGERGVLELVYGMTQELPSAEELRQELVKYRKSLAEQAGFTDETAKTLAVSADQFISYRASTTKQTILAGFPFFEDWGRDTMIAINGCCLATHQYETAKSILQTFRTYCQRGLMPNLFPEGEEAPGYNTVDAALLFILAVYEYYRKTKDAVFVKSMYGTMAEIVEWYRKGTDYGIHMDKDRLIAAGRDYDQVTWMDVRVGDILPTPRHGKPVEINAYWYNALCIMEEFGRLCPEQSGDYGALAAQVKESFGQFWNEEAGCLKDVLSGTEADTQIRCNQIWAVSLPFSVLSPEREKQVVDVVFRKLYTPYGLRTLDPADREFRPFYGGEQLERDLAYHQGTVWVFPLGGYYLAYLKVYGCSAEAKRYVKEQLEALEAALREGCVGQLPEIYDGGNPVSSKGCFAQAWSVGEILRVYDALERV
ncbi:MAG: amylo-alpha-1,6-glucosidase, partial [Acetatifactor sp.]|nr:amylo-alpha-1,6-glucosidase [Acetatifactor sp.]